MRGTRGGSSQRASVVFWPIAEAGIGVEYEVVGAFHGVGDTGGADEVLVALVRGVEAIGARAREAGGVVDVVHRGRGYR